MTERNFDLAQQHQKRIGRKILEMNKITGQIKLLLTVTEYKRRTRVEAVKKQDKEERETGRRLKCLVRKSNLNKEKEKGELR